MTDELAQNIASLQGDGPITGPVLTALSGLDRTQAARLSGLLEQLTPERQSLLVETLLVETETSWDVEYGQIFRVLLAHDDARIRWMSIKGLLDDGRPDLINPLLHLLDHDPDESVRIIAATALGYFVYMGEIDEIPLKHALPIRQALEQHFLDDGVSLEVARHALESLAFINDDIIKGYIDRAYSSELEAMRISAVFAMGRHLDESWGDTVLGELYSDSPAMRFEAIRAAGELQLREAVQPLIRMLNEGEEEMRFAAIRALGQISGKEARAVLDKLLLSDDETVSDAAEEALAEASLADMPFEMLQIDPLDASFLYDDDLEDGTEEESDIEEYRGQFHEYVEQHDDDSQPDFSQNDPGDDEDDDDEWPDEFLTLS